MIDPTVKQTISRASAVDGKPVSEIGSASGRLDDTAAYLVDLTERLESHLSPVLCKEPGGDIEEAPVYGTDMAQFLGGVTARLKRATATLESILSRSEL